MCTNFRELIQGVKNWYFSKQNPYFLVLNLV